MAQDGNIPPACGLNHALAAGLWSCPVCGRLHPAPAPDAPAPHCDGCGERIHARKPRSVSRTLAYTLASIALLAPSYGYPILDITHYGVTESNTILSGVRALWHEGLFGIALLVFVASFCVPLFKVGGLLYLCASLRWPLPGSPRSHTSLYRFLAFIGRWSMLDVFVVGLLAAIVQFGTLAAMQPRAGAAFFCAVVVTTLLATLSFDPRLIWDRAAPPPSSPGTHP
jgi:paraquat-inducible protein A